MANEGNEYNWYDEAPVDFLKFNCYLLVPLRTNYDAFLSRRFNKLKYT